MEPFVVHFGRHLKAVRKALGLTQPQLAERIGMSEHSVSKWECGEAFPERDSMNALAQALKLDPRVAFALRDPGAEGYDARLPEIVELEKLLEGQPRTVLRMVLQLARVAVRQAKRSS